MLTRIRKSKDRHHHGNKKKTTTTTKNKRTNDNLQNATQIDQHEPTLNTVGELRYSGRRRIWGKMATTYCI